MKNNNDNDSFEKIAEYLGVPSQEQGDPKELKDQEPAGDYGFAIAVIEGTRHKDYNVVVEQQKENTALASGKGYEDLLVHYEPTESEEDFKLRKAITHPITKEIIAKHSTYLKKAYQQPKKKDILKPLKKGVQGDVLLASASKFGPNGETLLKWTEDTCLRKAKERPNDFVMLHYKQETNSFMPEILYCESVLDFIKSKGIITDLVYLYSLELKHESKSFSVDQYMYLKQGEIVYFTEVPTKNKHPLFDELTNSGFFKEKMTIDQKEYIVTAFAATENPPVFSFGYLTTSDKDHAYYVPFWDEIRLMLHRFVAHGSTMDVVDKNHGYPKYIEIVEQCKYKDKSGSKCTHGKILSTGKDCPKCLGKGIVSISSEHDKIQLLLPEPGEEKMHLAPKDLAAYVERPIDILELLQKRIDTFPQKSCEVLFGVDMSYSETGNVTATQVLNFQGTGNAVISEYSELPERIYNQLVKCMAEYLGIEVEVSMEYTKDMSFSSERDLVDLLKAVKDSQASSAIVESVEKRLRETQQRNHHTSVQNQEILDRHKPFRHLSEQNAVMLAIDKGPLHPLRVLWEQFPVISRRVIEEHPDLAEKTLKQQEEIIASTLEDYIEKERSFLEESMGSQLEGLMEEEIEDDLNE